MNPGLVSLANTHIMDHGEQGLISMLDILRQEGIAYSGVGDNLKETLVTNSSSDQKMAKQAT